MHHLHCRDIVPLPILRKKRARYECPGGICCHCQCCGARVISAGLGQCQFVGRSSGGKYCHVRCWHMTMMTISLRRRCGSRPLMKIHAWSGFWYRCQSMLKSELLAIGGIDGRLTPDVVVVSARWLEFKVGLASECGVERQSMSKFKLSIASRKDDGSINIAFHTLCKKCRDHMQNLLFSLILNCTAVDFSNANMNNYIPL